MFANTNGEIYNYTYNADGIRTAKTMHDAGGDYAGTTEYIYDGTKLIAENRSGDWLYYFYDANGTVTGMYYNNVLYYFRKNLQGDVTGIYNANGTLVVEYEYTPYGAIFAITDANGNDISTNATHIANINPFRYRGYYYDIETGFYYLITRYYDPVVGRFLNADAFISTGQGIIGNNMFAYCGNKPVMFSDPRGLCYGYPDDPNLDSPNSGIRYGIACGNYGYHVRHKKTETTPKTETPSEQDDSNTFWGCIGNFFVNIWETIKTVPNHISASGGVCYGLGGELKLSEKVKVEAIMRADAVGFQFKDGAIRSGCNGKTSLGVGLLCFNASIGNSTFEDPETERREIYESDSLEYEAGWGFGFAVGIGIHFNISVSLSDFWEDCKKIW